MITEGAKSYTFNAASQLKSMTGPSGSQGTYRFDAMGNRVKRTWNYQSGSTWSGSLIAIYGPGGELLTEYKNETNSVYGETTTTYHIQMSGQTVARRVIGTNIYGGPASRTEWLHRNHLNQVVAVDSVNDSNQSVFGRIAGYSQPYNSGGSDQFQGHKDDPETSLHYNLARSYSPAMARWISADSVMARPFDPPSLNKYSYIRSDPVNLVDSDGREPHCPPSDDGCVEVTASLNPPIGPGGGFFNNPLPTPALNLREWDDLHEKPPSGAWEERDDALKNALSDLGNRATGGCAAFIENVIKGLSSVLSANFNKQALIDNIRKSDINVMGLPRSGIARTVGNTINLGGQAFHRGDYGRDLESTLFHEGFHLQMSSTSGVQIRDTQLVLAVLNAAGIDLTDTIRAQIRSEAGASEMNKQWFARMCGPDPDWKPR